MSPPSSMKARDTVKICFFVKIEASFPERRIRGKPTRDGMVQSIWTAEPPVSGNAFAMLASAGETAVMDMRAKDGANMVMFFLICEAVSFNTILSSHLSCAIFFRSPVTSCCDDPPPWTGGIFFSFPSCAGSAHCRWSPWHEAQNYLKNRWRHRHLRPAPPDYWSAGYF